jgi:hypothetical protein
MAGEQSCLAAAQKKEKETTAAGAGVLKGENDVCERASTFTNGPRRRLRIQAPETL